MRKVLSFSAFLMVGLIISRYLPVWAGFIFIALGHNLGGPALIISILIIVLDLILAGIFVLWVKKLALMSYRK